MTDREKLIDLIINAKRTDPETGSFTEYLGDFLLGYGVKLPDDRPVSREQVEKVWRGGWEPGNPICPICGKGKFDGLDADIWADWMPNFCPHCGAPMTDKAVDMVMERLEELSNGKG